MSIRDTTIVFKASFLLALAFLIWGALAPQNLAEVTGSIQQSLLNAFGWFYVLSASAFLLTSFALIFSRYGNIPLGKDRAKPEFPLPTWFAMLFCAGMGIGLVFWGVAEPLSHLYDPPKGLPDTPEAARMAIRYSFFHWGLHPWGIYTMVALVLAYFQFRKNMPGLISLSCKPILGTQSEGVAGAVIDIIAVFATVFGVATSLGFGAVQISGGLSYLFGTPNTLTTQLLLIGIVTVLYMLSAQTGLQRGIKYLSNLNMALASTLLCFVLFLGPTQFILEVFSSALGGYLQNLPTMSLNLAPLTDSTWIHNWTLFYWAWWIAWAPFVGTFIARISKGRTVREFVSGVLLVPTLFCAFWFSVFGGTTISLEMFDHVAIKEAIDENGIEVALFTVLEQFPMGTLMSMIAIFLIGTFFITSADSATFVLGTLTTHGNLNPPNRIKFTWGIIQSVSAAVLLWSGGLKALQTGSIIAAFPFAFIIVLMIISLLKSFSQEPIRTG
ncbi:MAG: BCCT family transporter [Nitrospirales bacterium]|nr:BCCT family transporter [Nitrospira sp.]MDR4500727.1 BCCT family transporter [Nitrospirales bacterium]